MLHFSKGKIILTDKLTLPQNMVLYEYVRDYWGLVERIFRDAVGFFCSLTSILEFSDLLFSAC